MKNEEIVQHLQLKVGVVVGFLFIFFPQEHEKNTVFFLKLIIL